MRSEGVLVPATSSVTELERRWRERLAEMTELAVDYHSLDEQAVADSRKRKGLLRRLVAVRQELARTEAALQARRAGCPRCEPA